MTEAPKLILKRSPLADAAFEDYRVMCEGEVVGRIYKGQDGASGRPWCWGIAYGYYRDPIPPHGYEPTREAAMAAFARVGCGNSCC